MATRNGSTEKFKHALDQQNGLERGRSGATQRRRDAAEAEAAQHGLGALEKHSKGRPKQKAQSRKATARKSPQAARSQAR